MDMTHERARLMIRQHLRGRAAPQVQLLSNGHYTVMMNAAGSGYSSWRDIAVTRWREDPVGDGWGSYILLRDEESGAVWSAGLQPYGIEGDAYTTSLSDDTVGIIRRDGTLTTALHVTVASDRDVELRRVVLTNHGEKLREITLTSYAELVLATAKADATHPAFSKLFVQTEWAQQGNILLATRRRRSPNEAEVWAAHIAVVNADDGSSCEFETDRMRFLGRGRTLRYAHPRARRVVTSRGRGSRQAARSLILSELVWPNVVRSFREPTSSLASTCVGHRFAGWRCVSRSCD